MLLPLGFLGTFLLNNFLKETYSSRKLELEKKYYKELEETLTDEELKVGREFAESAEKKIREKIKKNGDISKNDVDDILNELKEGENK